MRNAFVERAGWMHTSPAIFEQSAQKTVGCDSSYFILRRFCPIKHRFPPLKIKPIILISDVRWQRSEHACTGPFYG